MTVGLAAITLVYSTRGDDRGADDDDAATRRTTVSDTHVSLREIARTNDGFPSGALDWSTRERGVVLVPLDDEESIPAGPPLRSTLPRIVVGLATEPDAVSTRALELCDVVVPPGSEHLEAIRRNARDHPLAATAAAVLLRGADRRSVDDSLLAESATYSALQAGPEFARWRERHPVRSRAGGEPVEVRREGAALHIVLTRPQVRNALDVAMRDHLLDAIAVARADAEITAVHLWGEGSAFCAGGDLDEFGSFPDPATAHLIRLDRSIAAALMALGDTVTAHLHGACVGSGIELAACAATVLADPSTMIQLPEVTLGLVPGAGGTASLPRRIGRHRTALLALSALPIDAPTALAWHLVDAISPSDPST